jgi:hypothetical protein
MRAKGPFLTLLAGLAVAVVLIVVNANVAGGKTTAQEPAGNNAPAPAQPGAPAPEKPGEPNQPDQPDKPDNQAKPLNVTWAGEVEGGGATVAIVAKNNKAIAYVCDGKKTEAWLKGTAANGKLDLSGGKNTTLLGTFGDGRAKGSVYAAGKRWTFDVGTVKKPSGLYRATEDVRGARVEGGWIVLADGTQVGVVTVGGRPAAAPRLDLDSGTATVNGASVTAGAVDPAAPGS